MRLCIFCSHRANSKEDTWPIWLQKCVNRGYTSGPLKIWRGPDATPDTWGGPNAAIKVRHVCKSCNNGWMSGLETANKSILGALVTDFALPLEKETQELIALWVTKTAMVFECLNPKHRWFFTDTDRQSFLVNWRPPDGMLIWLGRYAHYVGISGEARRLGHRQEDHNFPLSEGYLSTFVFGHLVLQSLMARRNPKFNNTRITRIQMAANPVGPRLIQIWPIKRDRLEWPPTASFSDSGQTLDSLAERFTLPT